MDAYDDFLEIADEFWSGAQSAVDKGVVAGVF